MQKARGYIASGEYRGNRIPQHIQNRIIRDYCERNGYDYVLSRAEYRFQKESISQLKGCLRDGYPNIVFFSIWQLPKDRVARLEVYANAIKHEIRLHFACEDMVIGEYSDASFIELICSIGDGIRVEE